MNRRYDNERFHHHDQLDPILDNNPNWKTTSSNEENAFLVLLQSIVALRNR